jgi:hypothetical protein
MSLVEEWLRLALTNRNYKKRSKSYNSVWYLIQLVFVMRNYSMEDIWLIVTIIIASGCVIAVTSYTFLDWIP